MLFFSRCRESGFTNERDFEKFKTMMENSKTLAYNGLQGIAQQVIRVVLSLVQSYIADHVLDWLIGQKAIPHVRMYAHVIY